MVDIEQNTTVAFGDESIRISAPTPAYIMAATVLPPDANLTALSKIKPKGASKLHWRELTDRLRSDALAEVSKIGGFTTVVVATPLPKKKQERGRRKCLELLLPELEKAGVDLLILESRVLQMNKKDIEMLQAMRAKRIISRIGIDHAFANEEPNLWIPDQILGAYGDSLCGNMHKNWKEQWEEIKESTTILEATI